MVVLKWVKLKDDCKWNCKNVFTFNYITLKIKNPFITLSILDFKVQKARVYFFSRLIFKHHWLWELSGFSYSASIPNGLAIG